MKRVDFEKFNTPESPRNNRDTKLKTAMEKAKKYDDLIQKIARDEKNIKNELGFLKSIRKGFRFGYTNGYADGKIAGLEEAADILETYTGGFENVNNR